MTDDEHRIRLRLTGSRTTAGGIDLDALLAFGDHLRRALRAVARERAGTRPCLSGHPTAADERASALRLVGVTSGRAVLELEPTTIELLPPVIDTFHALAEGIEAGRLPELVHRSLSSAIKALGDGGSMTVTTPRLRAFRVDAARLAATVQLPPARGSEAVSHVDGWLHGIDVEPDELRIRDAAGQDWRCRFAPAIEATAAALLGAQVRAEVGERAPGPSAVLEVTDLRPLVSQGGALLRRGLSAADVIAAALAVADVAGPQSLGSLDRHVDPDDPEEIAFVDALRAFG